MELVNQRVMRAPIRFKLPGEFKNRFRKNGTAVELSEPAHIHLLTALEAMAWLAKKRRVRWLLVNGVANMLPSLTMFRCVGWPAIAAWVTCHTLSLLPAVFAHWIKPTNSTKRTHLSMFATAADDTTSLQFIMLTKFRSLTFDTPRSSLEMFAYRWTFALDTLLANFIMDARHHGTMETL